MWDPIEHLRAPHLYVEKIARLTEPGSLLAVTTADVESFNSRLRGKSWRMIHPPTHLHYFSAATLTRLFDRYDFEVIYNRYCGFYRSFGNVAYNIFVLRQQSPCLFTQIHSSVLPHSASYPTLYTIMN